MGFSVPVTDTSGSSRQHGATEELDKRKEKERESTR
jgi:hypothetical protein